MKETEVIGKAASLVEERAVWLKHNGYNCCQSVIKALTESDESISQPEQDLLNRAASGFRTGMGGMETTCGALCGAVMVAGLKSEPTEQRKPSNSL